MLRELRLRKKVVGVKQTRRALGSGMASQVLLAADADPALTGSIRRQCEERAVPVSCRYTMRELGQAAGIQVDAAVVTLLKEAESPL